MKGGRGPAPKFEGILGAGNRAFFFFGGRETQQYWEGDRIGGEPLGAVETKKKGWEKKFFPLKKNIRFKKTSL